MGFRNMMALAAGIVLLTTGWAAADFSVTNVTATPRWPWNGLVDIEYEVLADDPSTNLWVAFSARDTDRNIWLPVQTLAGDGADGRAMPGKRRAVWDTASDGAGMNATACAVTVTVSDEPTYMVIDLSSGTNAATYPVAYLAAAPAGGWTDEYKTDKLVMRRIPAGTFAMGSPSNELGRSADESPHEVTLTKDFFIGVFEVTQRQWERVMGSRPSYYTNALYYAARPVERVSHCKIRENPDGTHDPAVYWPSNNTVSANSFMGLLRSKTGLETMDLPTEAQWEYACRAGTTSALNSAQNLSGRLSCTNLALLGRYIYPISYETGNRNADLNAGSAKAGSYRPNAWDLYDMHGNVWEWCLDLYAPYIFDVDDPPGPTSGAGVHQRVLRGGDFISYAQKCRSATRYYAQFQEYQYFGFRAACPLPSVSVISQRSATSALFRLDARTTFGGRLACGQTRISVTADGVATGRVDGSGAEGNFTIWDGGALPATWNTTNHADGWYDLTLSPGALTSRVAVLNGPGVQVREGTLTNSTTWSSNDVQVVRQWVVVPEGVTLTIEPGAIVKVCEGAGFLVKTGGTLNVSGAILTHIADDTIGGDTNMDGDRTVPTDNQWAMESEGVITSDVTTEFRWFFQVMRLSGTITSPQLLLANQKYHVVNDITLGSGGSLTIQPGVIMKFAEGKSLIVNNGGTLNAVGTRAQPIVFTSIRDDQHGGDSNGDGDTTRPAPGDWKNIHVAGTATLAHVHALYGAPINESGILETAGLGVLNMEHCIVSHAKFDGLWNWGGTIVAKNTMISDVGLGAAPYWGNSSFINCVFNDISYICMYWSAWSGIASFENCSFSRVTKDWMDLNNNPSPNPTFNYCAFWNPSDGGPQSNNLAGTHGNIWGDPRFVDAANGDFRLLADSPLIDAGDGTVAPERDDYDQPRMDVASVPDTGIPDTNGICPDIGIYEMPGHSETPTPDLRVLDMVATADLTVGESCALEWKVANAGDADAQGSWRNTVFFQSESGRRVEAGEALSQATIRPGETNAFSASVVVPPLADGSWFAAIHVNSFRDVYEGAATTNNLAMAAIASQVSVPKFDVAGGSGVHVPAGGSTAVRLAGLSAGGNVVVFRSSGDLSIYGASGRTPSATSFEWDAVRLADGVWMLAIPADADPASVYVTLVNEQNTAKVVLAEHVAGTFYLFDPGVRVAPNSGDVTLSVQGAGFDEQTTVWLSNGGAPILPQSVTRVSETLVTAVFDVTDKPVGEYRLFAKPGAGTELSYAALRLTTTRIGPKWHAKVVMPNTIRDGRIYAAFLEYGNSGDTELPVPYVLLTSSDGASMRFGDTEPWSARLEIMAVSDSYPVSMLKPGETKRLPLEFKCLPGSSGATIDFTYTLSDDGAFPWENNAIYMRPSSASDELWGHILTILRSSIGETWDAWLDRMRQNLDHLATLGEMTHRLDKVWQIEINAALGMDPALSKLAGGADLYRAARGPDLAHVRTYHSGLAQRMKPGIYGRGWTDNHQLKLEPLYEGNLLVFMHPAGFPTTFFRRDGVWMPLASGSTTMLTEEALTYVLTYPDKTVQQFSKSLMRMTSVRDAYGNTLTYTYDAETNLASMVHSDGQRLDFSYTGGLLTQVSDDQGRTVTYAYTDGLLTSVTSFNGQVVQYRYLPASSSPSSRALHQIVYPDGTTRDYLYDDAGRILSVAVNGGQDIAEIVRGTLGSYSVIDATGAETKVKVGAAGELRSFEDALGQVTRYAYEAGRPLCTSVVSPTGKRTLMEYDTNNRMTRGTDAAGFEADFAYHPDFMKLAMVTDPRGQTLETQYDNQGGAVRVIHPDGTQESVGYSLQGDIVSVTNRRGQVISLAYDSEGRVTSKVWPNGRTFSVAYDPKGNPTQFTDSVTGAINLAYDAHGRLTALVYPGNRGFTYAYDALGRVIERAAHDGHKLKYSYDLRNRLAAIRDENDELYLTNAYHETLGDYLVGMTYGNGASATYQHDKTWRVTNITHRAGNHGIMDSFTYSYDADNQCTALQTSAGTNRYEYDLVGQLTAVDYSDSTRETFTYDPVGNRVSASDPAGTNVYAANAVNQYTQAGSNTFTYDADGNMTSRATDGQTTTYEYDVENRLTRVVRPDSSEWSCQYDAFGNRVSVTDNGVTSHFVFVLGRLPSVAAEYAADGSLRKRYIHVGPSLIADETSSADRRYYHADLLSSTRILTGPDGASVGHMDYAAFGVVRSSSGETTRFGYVGTLGVELDATGLLFMRNRYYSPELGRFIQADPIGLLGGDLNMYRYCRNNVLNLIDPSGLGGDGGGRQGCDPLMAQEFQDWFEATQDLFPGGETSYLDLALRGAHAYLDWGGIFDPTPTCDGLSAVLSFIEGDWVGVGISAVSAIPYVGDAVAKTSRISKHVESAEMAVKAYKQITGSDIVDGALKTGALKGYGVAGDRPVF